VSVLSRLFRRLFRRSCERRWVPVSLSFFSDLAELKERSAFEPYLAPLRRSEWVVYAKRPFAGPNQVLAYLARYTHRVAIRNTRLISLADGAVTFRRKDLAVHRKSYCEDVAIGLVDDQEAGGIVH